MRRSSAIFAVVIVVFLLAGLAFVKYTRTVRMGDRREWVSLKNDQYTLVIEGEPVHMVPSQCELHAIVRSPQGKTLFSERFGGGWRIDVKSGAVSARGEAGPGLVELHSEPFINGRDISRQYYRVIGGRLALVRLEDDQGQCVPNIYKSPNHTIGPGVAGREPDAWEASLSSADPGEVLWALVWLGGTHAEPEPPPPSTSRESLEAAELFHQVRKREGVEKRLQALTKSSNPWIAEAAKLAVTPITK